MTTTPATYDYIRRMVMDGAGIVLDPGKEYLIESRLQPLAHKEGLASLEVMIDTIKTGRGSELRRRVLDAMTTNETTFFRDTEPFELVRTTLLPALIEARRSVKQLRIWYAASSTGQEPYSVSMIIREHFPELSTWRIEQVATDFSRQALERAKAGRYSQLEVNRGMPAKLLVKYFTKHGLEWQLSDDIRKMVKFEELNLNSSWPAMQPFDIVFIRNVMIYFDVDAKKRILGRIFNLLRQDGYLFLGAAETTLNLDERFARTSFDRAGCYRVTPAALAK